MDKVLKQMEKKESERHNFYILKKNCTDAWLAKEEAVSAAARSIRRARSGLEDPKRQSVHSYSLDLGW